MKVVVTGATGSIGSALVARLAARGDSVVALTRNPEKAATRLPAGARAVEWSPSAQTGSWRDEIASAAAVVNLAGEPVADKRWTDEQKRKILNSRVEATRSVASALQTNTNPTRVLVNGSASGFYGSRGDEVLTEASSRGNDFLADVVVQWEAEAAKASESGTRVVMIRSGIVLGTTGGALPRLMLPFKMYGGGVMGPPDQWISWIHIDDEIGIILKAIDDVHLEGPVNAAAPSPVQMREFSKTIGRALHRPVWAPGIPFATGLILGDRTEVVFASQRIAPQKILAAGYEFRFTSAQTALEALT